MGMGKNGIPWVPWDSHGTHGSKISHGMRMGREWEFSAREWELRRGSCHQQLWIVFCSYIVAWSPEVEHVTRGRRVRAVMRVVLQPETEQVVPNWSKLTLITLILEKLIGLLWLKFVTTYFLRIAWCLIWVAGWELLDGKIWEWGLSFRWKWEWDENGNKVIEMGENWYEKSVPAHL